MRYSPKLKKAMEEIKSIAEKYDIGALVVLHEPGFSEYWLGLEPRYSGIKFNGAELRVRIKREDFKTDAEHVCMLRTTSNMLEHLTTVAGGLVMSLYPIHEEINKKIKAEHSGGQHTSQQEIDN